MKFLISLLIGLLGTAQAHAAFELSYFLTQRNTFVIAAEDGESVGLTREIKGERVGDLGLASRFHGWGLEGAWHLSATGPLARIRVAPQEVQLRDGRDVASQLDVGGQVGHAWAGPSMGALSTSFELGLAFRRFISANEDRVASSGLAGGFWAAILNYDLWSLHTEASLLAFPLGSQGAWGVQRDANSLRLRLSRKLTEGSGLKLFGEFYHLHRTFTDAGYGLSEGLFVSDVSVTLGGSYTL